MLISPAYQVQIAAMHADESFGTSGHLFAAVVKDLLRGDPGIKTALDYGCGKGTLKLAVPGPDWREYDPAVPGKSSPPEVADLVCCTEVLEHVEPDCLGAVLDDLKRLSRRWCFMSVEFVAAIKVLPDGRNAHLIQEPWTWWEPVLSSRFKLVQYEPNPEKTGMVVLGMPLSGKR